MTPVTAAPLDLERRLALPNGFEAYLVPRPGAPLVALLVAVRTPPTDGTAHVLEHLVFEGTAGRGRDEIFRWVYGIGGYLNGFTRDDFTGYVLMGPPGELPAMARLLAELLSGARLSPEALAGVKPVVLEELRQAQADPGYRDELAFRAARFAGTPYAAPALGTEASIGALGLDEVTRFYRERYTPDNMVGMVVGGAGADDMARALRDAFGPLRGTAARLPRAAPRALPGGAVLRAATQRTVRVAWLGPAPGDAAFGDFLALGDLLSGPASPLGGMQARVATEGAVASLEVHAELPPGADPDATLGSILAALERLAKPGGRLTADVAARAARHARLEGAKLEERLHYFAMARAPLLVAGRPDLALGPPPTAGPDALRAALARTLAGGYAALLPGTEATGTSAQREGAEAAAGPGRRRGDREPAGAAGQRRLRNGLAVAVETRPGSSLVAAHLLARGRLLAEPEGLPGAAEILHRLVGRQVEAALAALGATVVAADDPREPFGDAYFTRAFSGFRLETLPGAAEPALRALADAVAAPRLDPRAVAAARSATAALADFRATTPRTLAEDRLAARLFLGRAGAPPAGGAATFSRATPAALRAFHRRYFAPGNLVLTLVGGDSPERLLAMAERSFGRLEGEGAVPLAEPLPAAAAGGEPHRVKLGSSQGYLRTGAVVEVRGPRERAALALAVGMLGAALFSTLRDRQGLAYSVGADLEFLGPYALVSAGLGAAPDALDRALSEVQRVIAARAAAPVSPEEVARRAKAIAGRLASRQLASAIRAYYLGAALFAGAPHRYGDDYAALLGSIRPEEVEEMQRQAFGRPFAAVLVE